MCGYGLWRASDRVKNIRHDYQHDRKNAAQPKLGNVLCADCAEVATYQKARGQQKGNAQIGIAVAVVLEECEDADGGKKRAQRSPLRFLLIHAEEPDQGGYEQHAAADSDDSRNHSHNHPDKQRQPDHPIFLQRQLPSPAVLQRTRPSTAITCSQPSMEIMLISR